MLRDANMLVPDAQQPPADQDNDSDDNPCRIRVGCGRPGRVGPFQVAGPTQWPA
jgi:hypothetical protein